MAFKDSIYIQFLIRHYHHAVLVSKLGIFFILGELLLLINSTIMLEAIILKLNIYHKYIIIL